jgi:hypothetical protein
MYLYKLAALLILNVVFVQAWYTTVVESGKTIIKTKSRSRSASSTTTAAVSAPTFTVTLYDSLDCTGEIITTSLNSGCFNHDITQAVFSAGTTSTTKLKVDFYPAASCAGNPLAETRFTSTTCGANIDGTTPFLSYSVTTV